MARARVGVSGWRYAPWRGVFYPPGLVQRRELEYIADRLDSVEINGTFYSLQARKSFERWRDETDDDFVLAVKGGRFITHMLRMQHAETALANFFAQGLLALGPQLGPILWQLPARQRFDAEVLAAFLDVLPGTTREAAHLARRHDGRVREPLVESEGDEPIRYALEVRHDSFDCDEAASLLRDRNVALVVADTAGAFPDIRRDTADFAYVRLHGDAELYTSGYEDAALDRWASTVDEWLAAGRDTYVYFDNDVKVRAPFDAMGLRQRLTAGRTR